MEIVIGTANPAKARQCELALRATDVQVRPLDELLPDPPETAEDGWSAEVNAARKACAHCQAVGLPVYRSTSRCSSTPCPGIASRE